VLQPLQQVVLFQVGLGLCNRHPRFYLTWALNTGALGRFLG
jgi:hypothetical protein